MQRSQVITLDFNIEAAIIHWVGAWGKEYIRNNGFIPFIKNNSTK